MAFWAILPLPFLILAEILPDKLKEFGMSFCMTDTLGYGCMFLFAEVCRSLPF